MKSGVAIDLYYILYIICLVLCSKNLAEYRQNMDERNMKRFAAVLADLFETLTGACSFTVFVPNNKVFAKLAAGTIDKPLNLKTSRN